MSMPPENEFAELRKLLAIKRHEQPPPGFFPAFSGNVISALQHRRRSHRSRTPDSDVPAWVVRLFDLVQARPAFSGAFGALTCVALLGGMIFFEKDVAGPREVPSLLSEITPDVAPAAATETAGTMFGSPAVEVGSLIAETNVRPSLFDTFSGLDTMPVAARP